jgi:hypothetical protein
MKSALVISLLVLNISIARGEQVARKIEKIDSDFEAIRNEIGRITDPDEKSAASDKLREAAERWFPFSFLYHPNGSDELQEDFCEDVLVDAIYAAFTAEESHLHRAIRHTDGKDARAREIMALRANSLARLYPVGRRLTIKEDVFFAQIVLRLYHEIPDAVSQSLESNLPRWKGEERAVALLVLAHRGDETAQEKLKSLRSERVRKLEVLVRVSLDPNRE